MSVTTTSSSVSALRIVKRYANRKLYDTEHSCYVTLEDIASMIRTGDEVQVIDNKTGEDLTSVTLAQIIFETEKKKNFMPLSLLRDLIQDRSDALGDYAKEGVGKVQARAHDLLDAAQNLRQSAERIRTGLEGRIERVIHRRPDREDDNNDSTAGTSSVPQGEGAYAETGSSGTAQDASRLNVVLALMAASRETFDALQKGVEQRVVGSVSAVSRGIGGEIEDIRKRMADLESRIEKFLQ